ncbi:hypothetical protein HMPREF9441_02216 [Paraprevotella clara YIT 11840]|uniref:Uncharacterized protein n=1 Tax=Paraprevotella clara YIT 11840 TaxID=762968 RepID=G5SS66_9BACT|nr:hypothetical protein HMPREF9441_02216 [Paraprevotella clara YIT 11840]
MFLISICVPTQFWAVWGHKTVKKWSFSAFFFLNYFFNKILLVILLP